MANKKKTKVDNKEYDLSEFDERRWWSKDRDKNKKVSPKSNQMLPNLLGRT